MDVVLLLKSQKVLNEVSPKFLAVSIFKTIAPCGYGLRFQDVLLRSCINLFLMSF